jgi:hypothetical protein
MYLNDWSKLRTCGMVGRGYIHVGFVGCGYIHVEMVGFGYVNVRMTGEATYCTHVEKAVCGWVRLHTCKDDW